MSSTTLQLHHKFECETAGSIDLEGRVRALLYMRQNNIPYLPDDFDWVWNMPNEGKLTTRIKKYFFKEQNVSITKEQLAEIGAVCGKYREPLRKHIYDFTNHFDWQDGDFGDEGSCFWGSNKNARDMMIDAKFLAIRFYDPKNQNCGIGRAWVAPDRPDSGSYIVFNAYGPLPLRQVAGVLAAHLGNAPVRALDIYNNDNTAGTLYLNGGKGCLVGVSNWQNTKFDFKVQKFENYCYHCELPFYGGKLPVLEGHKVCPVCTTTYYTNCGVCNTPTHNNDLRFVHGDTQPRCWECAQKSFTQCNSCGTFWPKNQVKSIAHGNTVVCPECLVAHTVTCASCSEPHLFRQTSDYRGARWCDLCSRSKLKYCYGCDQLYPREELIQSMCEKCRPVEE